MEGTNKPVIYKVFFCWETFTLLSEYLAISYCASWICVTLMYKLCHSKFKIAYVVGHKSPRTLRGKIATYVTAENQHDRLQNTPFRSLFTVAPSQQFWYLLYRMAFRAAVVLLLMSSMSSNYLPLNISFIFGNRKYHSWLGPWIGRAFQHG
jgi:hypothetical protein